MRGADRWSFSEIKQATTALGDYLRYWKRRKSRYKSLKNFLRKREGQEKSTGTTRICLRSLIDKVELIYLQASHREETLSE